MEGSKPLFGHMYSMSDSGLKDVRKWIDKNLSKSFICTSSSSAASPILFVKKKESILCHFDPELETLVETNTSDYVTSGILS